MQWPDLHWNWSGRQLCWEQLLSSVPSSQSWSRSHRSAFGNQINELSDKNKQENEWKWNYKFSIYYIVYSIVCIAWIAMNLHLAGIQRPLPHRNSLSLHSRYNRPQSDGNSSELSRQSLSKSHLRKKKSRRKVKFHFFLIKIQLIRSLINNQWFNLRALNV